MFDRILDKTESLGLDRDQARQLLGTTVALVFSPARGGPGAFLQAMRDHGLGDALDSWLGSGPNRPLSPAQTEAVLGRDAIARMADRTGLSAERVTEAAAAMLPEAIHELSEHGDLPATAEDIPAHVHGGTLERYLDEVAHWGRAAVTAGAATLGASVGVVPDVPNATVSDTDEDAPPRATPPADGRSHLFPWLAIAVAVALALLLLRNCEYTFRAAAGGPSPSHTAS